MVVRPATVSPLAANFGETLSTIKFAARAKRIKCQAVLNESLTGTVESLTVMVGGVWEGQWLIG